MTDAPDINQLARRYLDLWQDQVTALANDPAVAEAMARTYALMTKGAAAFAASMPTDNSGAEAHDSSVGNPIPTATAPGTTAVAAASGDPGGDVARLVGRIAELEERVLRLEAAVAGAGGGTAPRPRRRRG
jgi:hypothetical protein